MQRRDRRDHERESRRLSRSAFFCLELDDRAYQIQASNGLMKPPMRLIASRCDPHAKAFFESLLARNRARLQALVVVARELLHAIYDIFRSGDKYEGTKLFRQIRMP